jgi:hypothetical protein
MKRQQTIKPSELLPSNRQEAADALADITFRYAEDWVVRPTPANLKRLRGTLYKIGVWTEDYARSVLEPMVSGSRN